MVASSYTTGPDVPQRINNRIETTGVGQCPTNSMQDRTLFDNFLNVSKGLLHAVLSHDPVSHFHEMAGKFHP